MTNKIVLIFSVLFLGAVSVRSFSDYFQPTMEVQAQWNQLIQDNPEPTVYVPSSAPSGVCNGWGAGGCGCGG